MRPDVELRLPADSAYVSVLRMTTAGIAARLDFTLDDIEDLRMAVGEACALLLVAADPRGSLRAEFQLDEGSVRVRVSTDTPAPAAPATDTFAWQVLNTVAQDVHADVGEHDVSIRLTITSTTSARA